MHLKDREQCRQCLWEPQAEPEAGAGYVLEREPLKDGCQWQLERLAQGDGGVKQASPDQEGKRLLRRGIACGRQNQVSTSTATGLSPTQFCQQSSSSTTWVTQGGSSAPLSPATAAVDRSCCTRVRRIRASTHSLSKSSSSRISIWRVAVTDGCKGTSAFKERTMEKISTSAPLCHHPLSAHTAGSAQGRSGFCCPKLCTSPCHKPPPLLICQGHQFLSYLVFRNSCCSACPACATKEFVQKLS